MKVEISKSALKKNIQSFKSILSPNTKFVAVVKSNAYGHGILEISKLAIENGADLLAVNSIDEALLLRQNFPQQIIIIMGDIFEIEKYSSELNDKNFWIVCSRFEQVRFLNSLSEKPCIHLKIDTGMGRLGYSEKNFFELLNSLKSENFSIQGILTHFASTEDFTEHSYTQMQLNIFNKAIQYAEDLGFKNLIKHAASSSSTILFPEAHFDLVRIGISLYGNWASLQTRFSLSQKGEKAFELEPVLTWKTNIIHIQNVESGSYIGYGSTYKTNYPTKLAVLPVGYFEGLDRRLSNIGYVLVKGERARIIGRVCMNMCMIDITHIENIFIGDEIVLIGKSGNEKINADSIAELTGTINYQVLTSIHPSIKREIVE